MKYFILGIFIVIVSSLNAYSQTVVSAKLIDKETKRPIDLVTVVTNDAHTATNELGEFEIKTTSDHLVFSHVGYHKLRLEIKSLPNVIELQQRAFVANEVVVKPDYAIKHLKEVQKKYYDIIKKYKNKFPQANLFYRQQSDNGNVNTQFIECFFIGKNGVSIGDLTLQNGRYAKVKTGDTIPAFNLYNAFLFSQIAPVNVNPIKKGTQLIVPLSPDFQKYYDISLSHTIDPNTSNETRAYKFTPNEWSLNECPNPIAGGLLYIRTRDNFILRFQEESTKQSALKLDKQSKSKNEVLAYKEQLDIIYSDKFEIPTVESVKVTLRIKMRGFVKGKEEVINFSIKTIMFTTSVQTQKSGKKIKNSDELIKKVVTTKYDPVFWENNPVIKRTPIENKIIEDFTRLGYFGNFEIK